jgi:hypothetical protein
MKSAGSHGSSSLLSWRSWWSETLLVTLIRLLPHPLSCYLRSVVCEFSVPSHTCVFSIQICKDKEEAEVWFCGLEALISGCQMRKLRSDGKIERTSDTSSPIGWTRRTLQLSSPFGSSDSLHQVCFFHWAQWCEEGCMMTARTTQLKLLKALSGCQPVYKKGQCFSCSSILSV